MKQFYIATIILILSTSSSNALESGYYQLIENKTLLNLSENAEKKVKQDRIKATLRINKEAKESSLVQSFINEKMNKAINLAEKYKDVIVSTGNYNVNHKYNSKLRINDGWRGYQEIILDSKNLKNISSIIKNLQNNGFTTSNMNYYLSRNKASSFRTELINQALKTVKDRTKKIAEQLKAKSYHIGAINVSNQGIPTNNSPRLMSMSKNFSYAEASPVAKENYEIISVNIDVSVILDIED